MLSAKKVRYDAKIKGSCQITCREVLLMYIAILLIQLAKLLLYVDVYLSKRHENIASIKLMQTNII